MQRSIPGLFYVAPMATDVATANAQKIGAGTGVGALALQG
jgi:hypothetical protein